MYFQDNVIPVYVYCQKKEYFSETHHSKLAVLILIFIHYILAKGNSVVGHLG